MVGTRMKRISSHTISYRRSWLPLGARFTHLGGRIYHYPLDSETIRTSLLVENVISQPSVMWRRNFFLQHQLYYNPCFDVAEDYDFLVRVAQVGQIANLPQVYFYYRWHPGQESQSKRAQQTYTTTQIIYRQLRHLLPRVDSKRIAFLFDFSQPKTIADLQEVDHIFSQLLAANDQRQIYVPHILTSVLANKYLSFCSNSARDLRRQVWQLWRHSYWRRQYHGSALRVYWLWLKSHGFHQAA
jgi:hypothetical protein